MFSFSSLTLTLVWRAFGGTGAIVVDVERFIELQVRRLTAAMPPDVRQVSDLPGNAEQRFRAAPALRGTAPICRSGVSRKATGLPHIGRQSRNNPAVNFIA